MAVYDTRQRRLKVKRGKKIGRRKLLVSTGRGGEVGRDKKEKLFLFERPIISPEIGREYERRRYIRPRIGNQDRSGGG